MSVKRKSVVIIVRLELQNQHSAVTQHRQQQQQQQQQQFLNHSLWLGPAEKTSTHVLTFLLQS